MADRVGKLEAAASHGGDRRRALAFDAAEFMRRMLVLVGRSKGASTDAAFKASIQATGDRFLIATFLGHHHAPI